MPPLVAAGVLALIVLPPQPVATGDQAATPPRRPTQPDHPSKSTAPPHAMNLDEIMHVRRLPQAMSPEGWRRVVDIYTAVVGVRYRGLAFDDDRPDRGGVQSTVVMRARLKVDREGRYTVHAGAGSGGGFRSGWNDTGLGAGPPPGTRFG